MKHNLKKLFAYLRSLLPLDDQTRYGMETSPFIKRKEKLRKKLIFASADGIAQNACFLESGSATAYRKINGEEVVCWFKSAPCGIIPDNFFTGNCCEEEIVIHARSTVVYISRQGIQHLFENYPQTQEYIRRIQETHLHETEEEKMLLRRLSAREKYIHLATTRPEVIQNAKVKDIASYLGIRLRRLYDIRKAYAHHPVSDGASS